VADAAKRIEAAGFDSAWVVDAHNRGLLLQDPFVALAIAASHTTRLEVGSCVIQAPLRHPFELAEQALTVHLVAGGRFLFGVGCGSTPQDYAAFGLDFAERFRLLDGHLRTTRRLWAGEEVDGASLPPWPGQLGGPPLLIARSPTGDGSGERPRSSTAGSVPPDRLTSPRCARASFASARRAAGGLWPPTWRPVEPTPPTYSISSTKPASTTRW
jgi:alkanesulfonate monooxygenase SsuD/methylene tetrahydromethanopterin reductase-like flavin-dependent oxidoreductase (luciferase family)